MRSASVERALNARVGRTLGLCGVVAGMTMYKSASDRQLFERWSPAFFGALIVMALAALLSAISGWRATRSPSSATSTRRALFDAGVALLGVAYLGAALDNPVEGGRLLDGNLFGATEWIAATLEWVAMALLAAALGVWAFAAAGAGRTNALLSAATVIFMLLLLEGASRAWTLGTASTHFGYAARIWQRRFVTRNHEGARDVEHSLRPTNGRRRLLTVGDSYAFGWGVPRIEDRLGERLAAQLSSGGDRWESLNVSEPDKNTLEEFDFLRRGLEYHPDIVVLVYVFNDMDYLVDITPRPMLAEAPRGLRDRLHPARLLFTNSYAFQELYARLLAAQQRREAQVHSRFAVYDDSLLVRRHLIDLARFVAMADSAGALTAIVPLDVATAVDPPTLRRYEHFVAEGRAAGLPMVSIAHAFDGQPAASITVSTLDGHPNARAHHIAAAAAAPALRQLWKSSLAVRGMHDVMMAGSPSPAAPGH